MYFFFFFSENTLKEKRTSFLKGRGVKLVAYRFLCTLTLNNPIRKRDRSSSFHLSCRTQVQKKTLHKACTPQHLCRGYLNFPYSNFRCFKPTVLRKCQSAGDDKHLSQDEITSSGHANGIDALQVQGTSHCHTWLSWTPHSISSSPGQPYSHPTLLKVKFVVSTTNIQSGFVSPQGCSIMHSGI